MSFPMTAERLRLETESMKASRAMLIQGANGRLMWVETLTSNTGVEYDLVIEYTERFPFERPHAVIVEPEIRADAPHRYGDDLRTLCLFHSAWDDTLSCTAGTIRARAALWLFFYENWCETGVWKGPELRH